MYTHKIVLFLQNLIKYITFLFHFLQSISFSARFVMCAFGTCEKNIKKIFFHN